MRCTKEIHYSSDGVLEVTRDVIVFGVDACCEGNQHPFTRKSVILGRTQPNISDRTLQAKTEETLFAPIEEHNKQLTRIRFAVH